MKKLIRNFVLAVLSLCFVMNTAAFAAVNEPTGIQAESAILVEKESGTVIYEKNADRKMYPASMTKILTSLLLLDYYSPEDVIKVGAEINEISLDSSKAGHIKGEMITVENLIRGLMIPSGNDSAAVAAAAIAKKAENNSNLTSAESIDICARLMNKKAEELGCTNSHFVNPHGYHDDDHYTTAQDMALIVSAALDSDVLKEIASEKAYSGNSLGNLESQYPDAITNDYNWKSHNMLIAAASEYNYEYATGFKTGFTDEAGDCVAATAEKDGVSLIAVIFNSEDPGRWNDAQKLFDFGYENYEWKTIIENGGEIYSVPLTHQKSADGDSLVLVSKEDIRIYGSKEDLENLTTEFEMTAENVSENKDTGEKQLKAPVEENQLIGKVVYKNADGDVIAETDAYASRSVEKANIFARAFYTVKDAVKNIFSLKGLITVIIVIVVVVIIIIIIMLIRRRRNRFYGGYSYGTKYKYKINKRNRF